MADIQTVIDALQDAKLDENNQIRITDEARCAMVRILMKSAELLKEQDKLLRKKQKDIDKLCCDIADLKHRFHEKTEIVRCKDCVRRGNADRCMLAYIAKEQGVPYTLYDEKGEWFCKDGERKE